LAASGLFLSVASVRLLRSGHRKLGGVSLVALAGAFWAQGSIGLAPGFWPAYAPALCTYTSSPPARPTRTPTAKRGCGTALNCQPSFSRTCCFPARLTWPATGRRRQAPAAAHP
jgi:hypothetical protein